MALIEYYLHTEVRSTHGNYSSFFSSMFLQKYSVFVLFSADLYQAVKPPLGYHEPLC